MKNQRPHMGVESAVVARRKMSPPRYVNHNQATAMASLLGGGTEATDGRRPKAKADFARANRDKIRQLERENMQRRQEEEAARPEPFVMEKFKHVKSRLMSPAPSSSICTPEKSNQGQGNYLRRGSGEKLQAKRIAAVKASIPHHSTHRSRPPVPKVTDTAALAPRSHKDFITENRREAVSSVPRQAVETEEDFKDARDYGKVPKYLETRKQSWAEEEERRIASLPDKDCPPGHKRMPEEERQSTLLLLLESQKEAHRQLSRLPLIVETPMLKRKKEELEAKLQEIEDAKAIFAKEKVFIRK